MAEESDIYSLVGDESKLDSIIDAFKRNTGALLDGKWSNSETRVFKSLEDLKVVVEGVRKSGSTVVLVSGSYDLLHIGHARYLERARLAGDFLVVGIDSDEKLSNRKPGRPIIGQDERAELLTHMKSVDAVIIKESNWPSQHLINEINPDVLILTEGTYEERVARDLFSNLPAVLTLKRQAETSTSNTIRSITIANAMAEHSIARTIIGYFPVMTQAYYDFLTEGPDTEVYVLDSDSVLNINPDLRKDIRALDPLVASEIISKFTEVSHSQIISLQGLGGIIENRNKLILPNDEVSEFIIKEFDLEQKVDLVEVFLRWNRVNIGVNNAVEVDNVIGVDQVPEEIIQRMEAFSAQSSDWWRGVGAVLSLSNGKFIGTSNRHMPTAYTPAIDGDQRAINKRGEKIEIGSAIHAEADLIARAAREGQITKEAKLYITDFPCPNCAKIIAESGVSEVVFVNGYAVGDGQSVLNNAGVTISRLDIKLSQSDAKLIKYSK